jgi:hypothetical protein
MTPQEKAKNAYDYYYGTLTGGQVTADTIRQAYGEIDPGQVERTLQIKAELDAQQAAGAREYYSAGISTDNATWDMAFRMAEMGLSSVQDMEKRNVNVEYSDEGGTQTTQQTRYFNKATGADITDNWTRVSRSGPLKTTYNLHFTDDGMVMPYTAKETSDWVKFRDSTLKPIAGIALAAYGVPYVSTAIAGTTVAGVTLTAGSALTTGVAAGMVSGGVSLLGGNSFEEALKNALTSGLTAGATAGYADTIGQSLGFDAGSVASKAAGNAIIAGAKAGITDENILQSMASAAVATYLSNKDPAFDATEREGSLAKPGFDDGDMTTDFGVGVDYSLGSNLKFPSGEGIKVGQNFDTGINVGESPVDYGLGGSSGLGLATSSSPNLKAMGGGQGLTATKDDGTTLAGKDFSTGLTAKDINTGIKIGGVLMAGDEVIDRTLGGRNTLTTTSSADKYRNAPLAGFKMVKYDDPATGASKYIPFVGEEALLPPPEGYKRGYAKGGFVSKPVTSQGLASRK